MHVLGTSGTDGKDAYSEDLSYETYYLASVRADGEYLENSIFTTAKNYATIGTNMSANSALRPVITVSANSVADKSIGTSVTVDRFYKNKTGAEAKGYVRADSIATLLGKDIKSFSKIESGLPTMEADITWTKLSSGGYNSQTDSFDTSKYDYYIADRATKLQVRLTGAPAYNNGVLAIDTICNSLYGNLTKIKVNNGKTTKKVKVVLARNAKWEDFVDDTKISDTSYGSVWTANADDSTIPNKITKTQNVFAPTLFTQYENIDKTKGISKGNSEPKLSLYNMSIQGTDSWIPTSKKESYAYEKYGTNPWLKAINNAYFSTVNRNENNCNLGTEYWLTSRCTSVNFASVGYGMRGVTTGGQITAYRLFFSSGKTYNSPCHGLRPVLQVEK